MRRILLIALLALAVGCGSQRSNQSARTEQSVGGRTQTAPQSENDELTVYVTDTGERYHLSSCRTLRGNGRPISLGEARRRGYTACRVCQPPR